MKKILISAKAKVIAMTLLGIIMTAGITFTVLTTTLRTGPVEPSKTNVQPRRENGYSASGLTAPRKDGAGNITCEANPDKKGMIIETVTTDEKGSPNKVSTQC